MNSKIKFVLIAFFFSFLFVSCIPRNFSFTINDPKMTISTSKKWGGKFFVYFDDLNKEKNLKKEDFIEFSTGGFVSIIIDPETKYIYIWDEHTETLSYKNTNYKYHFIDVDTYREKFVKNKRVIPSVTSISIDFSHYEIIVNTEVVKKGNVLGN